MAGLGGMYEIGPFRLDAAARAVTHAGTPVALGERAVAVLALLVNSAQEYVPKARLMDEAWPDLVVEEANLAVQISAIRRALSQAPGGEKWIETLSRRGYRFVGPVTKLADKEDAAGKMATSDSSATLESGPSLALPDKPSIAVLPFVNMSGDASQEYFADGMVEEIITALSRIKWLFVIARTSSFTYKSRVVDVQRVGRELGVRYVLEGSVRKADQRVRITAQLIDAVSGAHLWAQRFDGSLEDVFELQDNVAVGVAGAIEPELIDAEIRHSREAPTRDLAAYDLYLRAHWRGSTSWDRENMLGTLELIEKALERDPSYGPALILAALSHVVLSSWSQDSEMSRCAGLDFARRALRVASDDPYVLAEAGYALAFFGEDINTSIELVDRALALNPSFARGWVVSGWLRLWAGLPELALAHLEIAQRLSPRAGRGILLAMGMAHFFTKRFDTAITTLRRALQEQPNWPPTYRFLASCYAHMGRIDDARQVVEKLRAVTRVVLPSAMHWRNAELREFFLAGLRLAAGEDTPNSDAAR